MKYNAAQIFINQLGKGLFENDIWYDTSIEYNRKTAAIFVKSWAESKESLEDLVEEIRIDLDIAPSNKARQIIKEFLLDNKLKG